MELANEMVKAAELVAATGDVVMDYDGKPVSIEDGQMMWWDAADGEHWNSDTCQFEDDEAEDDDEDDDDDEVDWDEIPYGWHGSPYKKRESNFAEQMRFYYDGLK